MYPNTVQPEAPHMPDVARSPNYDNITRLSSPLQNEPDIAERNNVGTNVVEDSTHSDGIEDSTHSDWIEDSLVSFKLSWGVLSVLWTLVKGAHMFHLFHIS